jgi:hypothetical protein
LTSDSERRPKRRRLTARLMSSMGVANELVRTGQLVHAGSIRTGLQAGGLCTTDRGNQHIGDWLGQYGLALPSRKQRVAGRTVVTYEVPVGGIARSHLEAAFITPDGWDWAMYPEFDSPCPQANALRTCPHPGAGPGSPGDSIEAPSPCTNSQVPAEGAAGCLHPEASVVDGPDQSSGNYGGEAGRPKRKPRRRKRVDEDLDLDAISGHPCAEDPLLAQLADIP